MNDEMRKWVLPVVLPLIVAIALFGALVATPGYIFSSDLVFPLELAQYTRWTYPLWNEYGSYSTLESTSRMPIMLASVAFANALAVPASVFEKLYYIIFPLWLAGASMFFSSRELLAKELTPNKQLAVCASCMLVFMLNPWAIQRIVHIYLLLSYALSPLLVLFTVNMVKSDKRSWQIAVGATLAASALSPHWMVFGPVVVLFSIFIERARVHCLKKLACAFSVFAALSAFYIVPLISASRSTLAPSYEMTTDVVELLCRNTGIVNSLRLMSYWGPEYGVPYGPAFLPYWAWAVSTFALPVVALSSAYLCKARISRVLVVVAIFTAALVSLSFAWSPLLFSRPIADIGWLMRDPDKLGAFIAISFAFLFGATIKAMLGNKGRVTKCLAVLSVALFLVSSSAMVPGVYSYFSPCVVPDGLKSALDKTEGGKIIWMPGYKPYAETTWNPHSDWGSIEGSAPYCGYTESAKKTANYLQFLEFIVENNMTNRLSDFLYIPSIRYLIHNSDVPARENASMRMLECLLLQDMKKYDGEYPVFENLYRAGFVSSPSSIACALSGLGALPTAYSLGLPNSTAVLFLEQTRDAWGYAQNSDNLLFSDEDSLDDLAASRFAGRFASLADMTDNGLPSKGFAKTTAYDLNLDGWRDRLEALGGNSSWEFDYDCGLVCTYVNSTIKCPIDIPREGEIWVRAFVSPNSSSIVVKVAGESHDIVLTGTKAHFEWFHFSTNATGKRNVVIESNGNCAVNVLFAASKADVEKAMQKARALVEEKQISILAEDPFPGTAERSARYSSGLANFVEGNASKTIEVPKLGDYYLRILGLGDNVSLNIQSKNENFSTMTNLSGMSIFGPFMLHELANISISSNSAVIDALMLTTVSSFNGLGNGYEQARISDVKKGAAQYSAKVKSIGRTAMILAESYDALWTLDGKTPLVANSFLNLYILNFSGIKEITIIYEPEQHFYIGAAISLCALAIVIVVVGRENNKKIYAIVKKLRKIRK